MRNGRVSSELDSTDATFAPSRYAGPANPVGDAARPAREMLPMAANAPPTVMHPKLNTTPWSTSYAMRRKPAKAKTKRSRYNEGTP